MKGPGSKSRESHIVFGALCPSKSGLMNKHIVKHIVFAEAGQTYRLQRQDSLCL